MSAKNPIASVLLNKRAEIQAAWGKQLTASLGQVGQGACDLLMI
jgi:hypothetical protein